VRLVRSADRLSLFHPTHEPGIQHMNQASTHVIQGWITCDPEVAEVTVNTIA